jgi:hypothetical protein
MALRLKSSVLGDERRSERVFTKSKRLNFSFSKKKKKKKKKKDHARGLSESCNLLANLATLFSWHSVGICSLALRFSCGFFLKLANFSSKSTFDAVAVGRLVAHEVARASVRG